MTLRRALHVTRAAKPRESTPTGARRDSARKREADEVASFVVIVKIFATGILSRVALFFVASSPPRADRARDALDPSATVTKISCANRYRVRAFDFRNVSIFIAFTNTFLSASTRAFTVTSPACKKSSRAGVDVGSALFQLASELRLQSEAAHDTLRTSSLQVGVTRIPFQPRVTGFHLGAKTAIPKSSLFALS